MYLVMFAQIIHAERERELEEAIRRRQLLRPQDDAKESFETGFRRANTSRSLSQRVRPTGG